MESVPSTDKSSEDSGCADQLESDTPGPSSASTASEIKPQKEFFIHKVSPYDTLAGLAIRYGLSVFDIKKANGLVSERGSLDLCKMQGNGGGCRKMSGESSQEWTGLSSIAERRSPFQSSTSRQPSSSYRRNDYSQCLSEERQSVSEIELELLDEEKRILQRREGRSPWKAESNGEGPSVQFPSSSSNLMRPDVSPKKTATLSEYFTSMATSFLKTTEQLFGTHHQSSPDASSKFPTIFEKFKKAASQSSLYGGLASGQRLEGMGVKRGSENSISGVKDVSKID